MIAALLTLALLVPDPGETITIRRAAAPSCTCTPFTDDYGTLAANGDPDDTDWTSAFDEAGSDPYDCGAAVDTTLAGNECRLDNGLGDRDVLVLLTSEDHNNADHWVKFQYGHSEDIEGDASGCDSGDCDFQHDIALRAPAVGDFTGASGSTCGSTAACWWAMRFEDSSGETNSQFEPWIFSYNGTSLGVVNSAPTAYTLGHLPGQGEWFAISIEGTSPNVTIKLYSSNGSTTDPDSGGCFCATNWTLENTWSGLTGTEGDTGDFVGMGGGKRGGAYAAFATGLLE